jgi:hypothetical protein
MASHLSCEFMPLTFQIKILLDLLLFTREFVSIKKQVKGDISGLDPEGINIHMPHLS